MPKKRGKARSAKQSIELTDSGPAILDEKRVTVPFTTSIHQNGFIEFQVFLGAGLNCLWGTKGSWENLAA